MRFKFTLRTLFVVVLMLCCGCLPPSRSRQWNAAARITKLSENPELYEVERIFHGTDGLETYGGDIISGPPGLKIGDEIIYDRLGDTFVTRLTSPESQP